MAKFRKIGILTSGGDAPGMNAAIRAIARKALSEGIEVIGINEGYSGLINGNIRPLDSKAVSNIITTGGTMLYSSRCPEFKTEDGMAKAIKTCEENQIDAIVACGGDGQSEETRDPNKPAATLDSIYAAVSAVVPDADKLTDAQATHLSGFFNGAVPEDFASYKIVMQTMSTSMAVSSLTMSSPSMPRNSGMDMSCGRYSL